MGVRMYESDGWHVVVGMGSAGSRHLGILRDLGVSRIAVVRSGLGPSNRPTPAGVRELGSMEEALALGPVAAIVATPTGLHFEQTRTLLAHRIPTLVEKPLASTALQMEELLRLAHDQGTPLLVGFHLRFHPTRRWIAEAVRSGEFGRPLLLRATWGEYLPGWHPEEDYRHGYAARRDQGGGPLLTLSHVVDYAVDFMGDVADVETREWKLSDLELSVPDVVALTVRHADRSVSLLEMDFVSRPPIHTIDIRLTEGRISWDVLASRAEAFSPSGLWRSHETAPYSEARQMCFVDQIKRFLELADSRAEPDLAHELQIARVLGELQA